MGENRNIRLSDIGQFFINSFKAIVMGQFLMRLNVGKYLLHIAYVFILFAVVIWVSLAIDTTLTRVEDGKKEIHELEINYTDKLYLNAKMTSREMVLKNLSRLGSELREPEKPATVIRQK